MEVDYVSTARHLLAFLSLSGVEILHASVRVNIGLWLDIDLSPAAAISYVLAYKSGRRGPVLIIICKDKYGEHEYFTYGSWLSGRMFGTLITGPDTGASCCMPGCEKAVNLLSPTPTPTPLSSLI